MGFLDTQVGQSYLNTPLYDNVVFPAGRYKTIDGEVIDYAELRIDACVLVISRTKKLIRTEVNGRATSIKEITSKGDYQIQLSGKLSVLEGFPDDQLEAFAGLEDVDTDVQVLSKLMERYFGITTVVLERVNLQSPQGSMNEIPISIQMWNDDPVDLKQFIYTDG